ncbi:hypothetical protein ACHAW6_000131 [Cyclotella cf. meneghiniana]
MIGSLDRLHTIWKNCSKSWTGSYQGKENNPSIVQEGISDCHMFFGMLLMDMQVPLMTKQYLTCHHFKNIFWIVNLKIKSRCLVLYHSPFQLSNSTLCHTHLDIGVN